METKKESGVDEGQSWRAVHALDLRNTGYEKARQRLDGVSTSTRIGYRRFDG